MYEQIGFFKKKTEQLLKKYYQLKGEHQLMNKQFFTGSKISYETDLFQKHFSAYSNYLYDQNFIWLKKEPSIDELAAIEENFMENWMNDAPMFKFNFTPSDSFLAHLETQGFSTEKMLIFTIPSNQLASTSFPKFEISKVHTATLTEFLNSKFTQDLIYGEEFAKINQHFLLTLFKEDILDLFIASTNQAVIGFATVIKHPTNIEIYDIYTAPDFRNQTVAKSLQQYVANFYQATTIVVVADYSDTPKEMYKKLGYKISGLFYQAQK
ncbi:hypothetical protein CK496_02340 [Enterococcus thailandicus]|nr:hypothetical protein CK496_02340 [Enterococcus thailandicus]